MVSVYKGLSELPQYREVLGYIVLHELKVKYRHTYLGYLWSLLNPILNLGLLSVVFSHVVKWEMREYTLYLFSGLLVWNFFQNTVINCSTCLLEAEHFIKKVYLPKMVFPLSRVALRAIDFCFSLFALGLLGAVLGFTVHPTVVYLPAAVLLLTLFNVGAGIMISVWTVYFRDLKYLVGVLLQMVYFATPILYPISLLPESYHPFVRANPIYPLIEVFQALIYHGRVPTPSEWGLAVLASGLMFLFGVWALTYHEDDLVFRM